MSEILCRATYRHRPVVIGRATPDELSALADPVDLVATRDDIDRWNLIAIRDPSGRGTQTHALGWRRHLANTWITSPIIGITTHPVMVSTSSTHSYGLGESDGTAIDPELMDHLFYALRTWGFIRIEPA